MLTGYELADCPFLCLRTETGREREGLRTEGGREGGRGSYLQRIRHRHNLKQPGFLPCTHIHVGNLVLLQLLWSNATMCPWLQMLI